MENFEDDTDTSHLTTVTIDTFGCEALTATSMRDFSEGECTQRFDARYEFNAPHFYDFTSKRDSVSADEWFESDHVGQGEIDLIFLSTISYISCMKFHVLNYIFFISSVITQVSTVQKYIGRSYILQTC